VLLTNLSRLATELLPLLEDRTVELMAFKESGTLKSLFCILGELTALIFLPESH
jgi:spore maturation protein SpmB